MTEHTESQAASPMRISKEAEVVVAVEQKPAAAPETKPKVRNATYRKFFTGVKRSLASLEHYMEDPSIVILFLLAVYVDLVLWSWSLFDDTNSSSSGTIESLRTVILYVQCSELMLQMILHRARFFSHWGYAFDTVLVYARLLDEFGILDANQHHLHLLSFLRAWRFVRVVQTFIATEIAAHDGTKKELSTRIESAEEWKNKAALSEEDADREKRISKQNREMVNMFQEEIDTLQEALRIAAVDVAAAMKGEYDPRKNTVVGIDVVEYENKGDEDNDGEIKAWVTHPVPKVVGTLVEESSVDGDDDR